MLNNWICFKINESIYFRSQNIESNFIVANWSYAPDNGRLIRCQEYNFRVWVF